MSTGYGFGKSLALGFDDAVERVVDALRNEGLGVLADIDIGGVLKSSILQEVRPYRVLAVCNLLLAADALATEPSVGLLLPCRVLVRQDEKGQTQVECMDPHAVAGLSGSAALERLACDARQRLVRAMQSLR